MSTRIYLFLFLAVILTFAGCANITTPTGGKKDTTPPKLISITPADSLKNTKVKRIEMLFDEYVTVGDASKEVELSPIISIAPTVTANGKKVVVKIVDSLLEDNTTYRLSFGNAIKDLHEGNPFGHYTYTFSTGAYFDSLQLGGSVISAATGLSDTGGIYIVLYNATAKDSAVVKQKPKYVVKADAKGNFIFKGLPRREFRIYAIKDPNSNLIYDGPAGGEMIAFNDQIVTPGDTVQPPVLLRMFKEKDDTSIKKTDTSAKASGLSSRSKQRDNNAGSDKLSYTVKLDTSNILHRTFDITKPIDVIFNKIPVLNKDKITLFHDDNTGVPQPISITFIDDTVHRNVLHITTDWEDNTVYTLKLAKGFAKDTSGAEVMPARFKFRTFEDEDYGKIKIHLPSKYYDKKYVLMVVADNDTLYQKPVTDTMLNLTHLKPGKYTFRIIVDKNGNGKWDTGDLFEKQQPEEIIPYKDVLTLKAGWDNIIDFEQEPKKKSDKIK